MLDGLTTEQTSLQQTMTNDKTAWQIWKESNSVKPWDLINPKQERATEEVSASRYEICNGCEHLLQVTKQCKKCGCFMAAKTKLEKATCPIGKW
jgi:hypothetical protein